MLQTGSALESVRHAQLSYGTHRSAAQNIFELPNGHMTNCTLPRISRETKPFFPLISEIPEGSNDPDAEFLYILSCALRTMMVVRVSRSIDVKLKSYLRFSSARGGPVRRHARAVAV